MQGRFWLAALAFAAPCVAALPARAGTAIALQGKGVQIYLCKSTPDGFAWRLTAPDATLSDAAGAVIGRHFAGPTWQAQDGSTVLGTVAAASPSPRPGGIPWLVLTAKSHSGQGMFASVTYITRTETQGGAAPATGCDAGHGGAAIRVPYDATYVLFSP